MSPPPRWKARVYTHDSDPGWAALVGAFSKDFPKIKATYFRAQNGAMYGKLLAERAAGRFSPDIVQFSELGTTLDSSGATASRYTDRRRKRRTRRRA